MFRLSHALLAYKASEDDAHAALGQSIWKLCREGEEFMRLLDAKLQVEAEASSDVHAIGLRTVHNCGDHCEERNPGSSENELCSSSPP